MSNRRVLVGAAAVLALITFYTLCSNSYPSSFSGFAMSSSASHASKADVAASDLTVKLAQVSVSPPVLRVTLQNTNPSTAFTVLAWDTPLDSQALNLGIFKLVDASTGQELKGPGLKVNRLLPPPRDDLVEVAPRSEVTKEVPLKGPWLPTDGNKKFKVSALGAWKSVWPKPSSDVKQQELEEAGGESALKGYFKSDEIEITL